MREDSGSSDLDALGKITSYVIYNLRFAEDKETKGSLSSQLESNIKLMSSSEHTRDSINRKLALVYRQRGQIDIHKSENRPSTPKKVFDALDIKDEFVSEFRNSRWVLIYLPNSYGRNPNKYDDLHYAFILFLVFYRAGINPMFMEHLIYRDHVGNKSLSKIDRLNGVADHATHYSGMLKKATQTIKDPKSIARLARSKKTFSERADRHSSPCSPVDVSPEQMEAIHDKYQRSMDSCGDEELSLLAAITTNMLSNYRHQDREWSIDGDAGSLGYSTSTIQELIKTSPKPRFDMRHLLLCINNGVHIDDFSKLISTGNQIGILTKNIEFIRDNSMSIDEFALTPKSWIKSWEKGE